MAMNSKLRVGVVLLSTLVMVACSAVLGFDDDLLPGSQNPDGSARADGSDVRDGGVGEAAAPNAVSSTGCSWCTSHAPTNGACWDFDCTSADAGALQNGWLGLKQVGGTMDLVSGHLPSSQPNAARSTIASAAGSLGQAFLSAGLSLDGGQETNYEFDIKPLGCAPQGVVDLGYITFSTFSGAPTLTVDLFVDASNKLEALLTCPSCNCGNGCTTTATGPQTGVILGDAPPDWARILIGISRPTDTTTVTFRMDEGSGPILLWSAPVSTSPPDKITVVLGIQKGDPSTALDNCAFAYDNVVVDSQ